jgi:hypothetical protein
MWVCGAPTPQNAAFFTSKGAGAGRQISENQSNLPFYPGKKPCPTPTQFLT